MDTQKLVDQFRSNFPILQSSVYRKPLVYLDSAATAQKPLQVIEYEKSLYTTYNANIHRGVHYLSEQMTAIYEQARQRVARFIGAKSASEVIFTSGATASLNLVAYSWSEAFLRAGDVVLVSQMEHHSNIVPWQMAAARRGAVVRAIPITDSGEIDIEAYERMLQYGVKMVAITQASNTLGTRPDLKTMITLAHKHGAKVTVDGCQGVVHGGVDVVELDCDFYVFSGHKLYGPTGIGVLYGKSELLEAMPPYMGGGDMVDKVTFERTTYAPLPLKFEAGTANFVGAATMAAAIDFLEDYSALMEYENTLLSYATEQLQSIAGLKIYGTAPSKSPVVCFNVEGCNHYDIGMILDKMGVAIRTGHHCAQPVMDRFSVTGMCRASFAMYNTMSEVDALVSGVDRAVKMLR
ncbi:MAG: SufS family cysteine desulfurase [Alistipes sp.]|nr:SufS family cysteine desulfurase [Alistipes sp.]